MASINISLPEALLTFLKEQVKKQGYSTVSEYIRALLRENQKGKALQEKLDALLLEGLESGPSTPMTEKDWGHIHEEVEMRIQHRKQK